MLVHLDNASTSSFKPPEILEGIKDYFYNIGSSPSRGGYERAKVGSQLVTETRKRIANLFNISNYNNLCFTYNATYGLNLLIKGFLQLRDHVIITSFEHNAVYRPIFQMEQDGIIQYDVFKCNNLGIFEVSDLEKLIKPNTKLIIANHASNVIGVVTPLKEIGLIANKHNIKLLADFSQTAGLLNIDLESSYVDFFAAAGHKCLLGPSGIGIMYIKNEEDVEDIIQGGTGSSSYSAIHPQILPHKFEPGTINYLGIAGLNSSLKYIEKVGRGKIYSESMALTQYCYDQLTSIKEVVIYGSTDFEFKVPIISFNIPNRFASEIGDVLNQNGIEVRTGQHCAPLIHQVIGTRLHGTCRVSIGHKNTIEDIDKFINVIKNVIL